MNRLLGRDVWAGLLFIGLGGFTILHSRNYPLGTLTAMGPGYFPAILGGMMLFFGATIAVTSLLLHQTARIGRAEGRAAVAVCASALCLALLLDRVGLPATVFCASVIACAARRDFLRPSTFILSAALSVLCVVVFVQVLNIPVRLLPAWWQGY